MRVSDITDYLESIAPLTLQESYDNSGLLVGSPDAGINSVLIALDVTPEVINEAKDKGCGLVIGHHPVIFRGLKRLTGDTYVERTVIEAIRAGIAIYAIHTNLDNVLTDGVNGRIAQRIGLENITVLSPGSDGNANHGAGVVGDLPQTISENDFLELLYENMGLQMIRHTAFLGQMVQKVAVCGGSGSFLLRQAISSGAGAYVSADFKYHEFFDAEDRILIADIGHFESERFTIDLIGELIHRNFPNFAVQLTSTVTNPIRYYPF